MDDKDYDDSNYVSAFNINEDDDIFLENGKMSYENPNYRLTRSQQMSNADSGCTLYEQMIIEDFERKYKLSRSSSDAYKNKSYMSSLSVGSDPLSQVAAADLKKYHTNFNEMQKNKNVGVSANINSSSNFTTVSAGNTPKMGRSSVDLTSSSSLRHFVKPDLIENTTENPLMFQENIFEKITPPCTLNITKQCSPYRSKRHSVAGSSVTTSSRTFNTHQQLNHEMTYNSTIDGGGSTEQRNTKSATAAAEFSKFSSSPDNYSSSSSAESVSLEDHLPPGWERHQDNDGVYYWHIKTGTIQKERPDIHDYSKEEEPETPLPKDAESLLASFHEKESKRLLNMVLRSKTAAELEDLQDKKKKEDTLFKRRSYPAHGSEDKDKGVRFAVRSLGWVEIAEEDLTPERSSKAVNKCIVDLSLGRTDPKNCAGRWAEGKTLFMDLDEGSLKLIDPESLNLIHSQQIHTIRVWGVGRDNGRDFAYVARDRITRKHMCHVFRCEIPARTIANTLRDICKKIMIERSMQQQNLIKPTDINGSGKQSSTTGSAVRPTNLPTEHRRNHHRNGHAIFSQSFPTPMEEPKKLLQAFYLGCTQVSKSNGIDILNEAIERMLQEKPKSQWQSVNVAVAPSMITISTFEDDRILSECRVRYLSFLGIGKDVKDCAFIMHTAQDLYVAHVFRSEPSAGQLCKTIEAACKLRYQKCLDAHPSGFTRGQNAAETPIKSLTATWKSFVGSFTGRKAKSTDS